MFLCAMPPPRLPREALLRMDFEAYLGSSSGDSGDESGTPGEGGEEANKDRAHRNQIAKYRSLLMEGEEEGEGEGEGREEMEITWEPGLRKGVEEMVKGRSRERQGREGRGGQEQRSTTWETYLKERSRQMREKRKAKVKVQLFDTECSVVTLL